MPPLDATPKIYLHRDAVDFRKSHKGLGAIVELEMGHNPFDGALYVFINRHKNKIKCIFWEDNGFVLYYKALAEEKEGSVETFYKKVKEELDVVPAKARVLEYLQETAVFLNDQKRELKTAAKSKHPLSKCIASISLLAYVIVSKYCDGLPLYRLEGILKRYGGEITRTSMANWIIRLSSQFQPLMNLLREQQLIYNYIQADETRMNVLKEKEDNKTQRWMWISRGGPG